MILKIRRSRSEAAFVFFIFGKAFVFIPSGASKVAGLKSPTTPGVDPCEGLTGEGNVNYIKWKLVIHFGGVAMRSTITARGQTVIPSKIRRQFNLTPSDHIEWVVEGDTIRVVPVREDPIAAFRGQGMGGGSTQRLLEERSKDRELE